MKTQDKVKIKDVNKVLEDPCLDEDAYLTMKEDSFTGKIVEVMDDVHFVSFDNDKGSITQGFKSNEIEVVK